MTNYGNFTRMLLSLKSNNHINDKIIEFKNDEEYLNAVKILINSSHETENRIDFFEKKILPYVKKDSILDIGVGNGELSKTIYKSFDMIHLVEPSLLALNSIKEEEFSNKKIEKFNLKIENFLFPHNFYDLVVNCHTLYHVKRNDWKEIINKSYESLNSEGISIIVLNDGLGRSKLTNFFGGSNVINIEKLIEECINIKTCSLEIFPYYEQAKTENLEEAIQIAAVFLQDINIRASKDDLIDYLFENCKQENNFLIDYCQYFIILNKKL